MWTIPANPSYVPVFNTGLTDRMSFFQRVYNVFSQACKRVILPVLLWKATMSYCRFFIMHVPWCTTKLSTTLWEAMSRITQLRMGNLSEISVGLWSVGMKLWTIRECCLRMQCTSWVPTLLVRRCGRYTRDEFYFVFTHFCYLFAFRIFNLPTFVHLSHVTQISKCGSQNLNSHTGSDRMGRRIKRWTDTLLPRTHHESAAQPQNVLLPHGRVFKAEAEGHIQGLDWGNGTVLCWGPQKCDTAQKHSSQVSNWNLCPWFSVDINCF